MTKPKLHLMPALYPNLLLLDGPARMGKFMASVLVGSLKHVDHPIDLPHFENMAFLARGGLMNSNTATALLRVTFNHCIYDLIIGRHLNTRPTDISAISNSLDYADLLGRMTQPEGMAAVERYQAEGRIPFFTTVDSLIDFELFAKAYPGLKAIIVSRHPVDVIESWVRNDIGARLGVNPREATVTFAHDKTPIPWWALDWANEYAEMTPADRCVRGLLYIIDCYEEALAGLDDELGKRLHRYTFEDMVTDPEGELQEIADFLGTELHPEISIVMARERIPRELSPDDRRANFYALESVISPAWMDKLVTASREYEARWNMEAFMS